MFLVFDSTYEARLVKAKIEDGRVWIDDKEFFVDQTKPLLLKKLTGFKPLYIIKWDTVTPSQITPEFHQDKNIDPALMRRLSDLQILRGLTRPIKRFSLSYMWLGFGIVLGIILLYALKVFDVIKF